jgi:hypothetical protein
MNFDVAGTMAATIAGSLEAIDPDGSSALGLAESDTNVTLIICSQTRVANRPNAGRFPDTTSDGRSMIADEMAGPYGDLISADVTPATAAAIRRFGIELQRARCGP